MRATQRLNRLDMALAAHARRLFRRYALAMAALLDPAERLALVDHMRNGAAAELPWGAICASGPTDLWQRIKADPQAGPLHERITAVLATEDKPHEWICTN